MDLNVKLELVEIILYGFTGGVYQAFGSDHFAGWIERSFEEASVDGNFLIMDMPSSYNVVFERHILNLFQDVISTHYMNMRFPV
ncbi:hypothetical protein ACS0TY_035439 [Phlomoides rotata]